jgi:hypothetical protein
MRSMSSPRGMSRLRYPKQPDPGRMGRSKPQRTKANPARLAARASFLGSRARLSSESNLSSASRYSLTFSEGISLKVVVINVDILSHATHSSLDPSYGPHCSRVRCARFCRRRRGFICLSYQLLTGRQRAPSFGNHGRAHLSRTRALSGYGRLWWHLPLFKLRAQKPGFWVGVLRRERWPRTRRSIGSPFCVHELLRSPKQHLGQLHTRRRRYRNNTRWHPLCDSRLHAVPVELNHDNNRGSDHNHHHGRQLKSKSDYDDGASSQGPKQSPGSSAHYYNHHHGPVGRSVHRSGIERS